MHCTLNVAVDFFLHRHSLDLSIVTVCSCMLTNEISSISWVEVRIAWFIRSNQDGNGQRSKSSDHIVQYAIEQLTKFIKLAAVGFWSNCYHSRFQIRVICYNFYHRISHYTFSPYTRTECSFKSHCHRNLKKMVWLLCNNTRGNPRSSLGSIFRFLNHSCYSSHHHWLNHRCFRTA